MPEPIKAVPEGFHTITPSLIIRDAAKAIDFYKKAFAAEELMRMPGPGGKVMHAEIRIGSSIVMMADENPEWECKSPLMLGGSPVNFFVYVENVDSAWRRAVDAGAKVKMPLSDQFWGDRMGALEDPFGHKWSLAQRTRNLTVDEIKKGQEEFFKSMKDQKKQ
jgi:uncharacterized glyoxalase superfamily protein PhnB